MFIEHTSFGGLLLHTSQGNYAVNCGGTLEMMEKGYHIQEQPLKGLILTSEHTHRSGHVTDLVSRHQIPVLTPLVTWAKLGEHLFDPVLVSPPCSVSFGGLPVEFHHLRYDGIDPVYVIVQDGNERIGIIPDGRITLKNALPLWNCQTLLFENLQCEFDRMPSALRRRMESVANTPEEIRRICHDYSVILTERTIICQKN